MSCCFTGCLVQAEDASESRAEATMICSFITPTELLVEVSAEIEEITVFDTVYNRGEIAAVSTTNPEVLGAIKLRVRDLLKSQLGASFGNASITAMNQIPGYEDNVFTDEFTVVLSSDFFDFSEDADTASLIAGILDIDGVITYMMPLSAESGWNNTYTFSLGPLLALDYANTELVNVAAKQITWVVANSAGVKPSVSAELSLQSAEPTSSPMEEEISIAFILDTRTVDATSLTIQLTVKTLALEPYQFLPQTVTALPYAPADALRLFIQNELLSWDEVYNTSLQELETQCISAVESSELNQNLQTTFLFQPETTINCSQPYNTSEMNSEPPLQASISDPSIDLRFAGATPRAFFGLINAGAQANISQNDLNFGESLILPSYNFSMQLFLPTNLSLDNQNPYTWNTSTGLSGPVNTTLQPTPAYTDEQIETSIVIDIAQMDLNIQSILVGKTELTGTLTVEKQTSYSVLQKPQEFTLPAPLQIYYLNADAFRLCIEESVFSNEELDAFLDNRKLDFEQLFSQLYPKIPIQSTTDSSMFYNSLSNWDGDITTMEHTVPIEHSTYATTLLPLSFSVSFLPPSVELENQTITLQGIPGNAVTYELVFPEGITVNAESLQDHAIIQTERPDGRKYIQVSFDKSDSSETVTLNIQLSASPLYIFVLFFPCLLSFLLVIFLVIIVLLLRRRKGRPKPTTEPTEPAEYQGQQYYAPPPPQKEKPR